MFETLPPVDFSIGPDRAIEYPPASGYLPLRVRIAEYFERYNHLEIDPSAVLVTPGGTTAIFVAIALLKLAAAARRGSLHLHCLTPTWQVLPLNQARILGVESDDLPLSFRNDMWTSPSPAAASCVSDRDIDVVLGAVPGNPIGRVLPLDWLRVQGAYTIVDATYEAMLYHGSGHLDLGDLAHYRASTFIVGSFSKTFAIPGFRIGFLISPKSFSANGVDVLTALTMGVSVPVQNFALRSLDSWLDSSGAWFRPVRDELRARAGLVFRTLTELGFKLEEPNAGYYCFAQLPSFISGSGAEFADRLLCRGVRIVSGDDFGGATFERFVRISFGNSPSIVALKDALASVQKECRASQRARG